MISRRSFLKLLGTCIAASQLMQRSYSKQFFETAFEGIPLEDGTGVKVMDLGIQMVEDALGQEFKAHRFHIYKSDADNFVEGFVDVDVELAAHLGADGITAEIEPMIESINREWDERR